MPALRPRIGTPSPVHSLRDGQAGEQQAPRKIQAKITSRGHTVGKQCLERPNIVLSYQKLTCATAHQDARSAVINRCGQMAAKHDARVDADRVGIAELLEWADRRRTLVEPRMPQQRLGHLINI